MTIEQKANNALIELVKQHNPEYGFTLKQNREKVIANFEKKYGIHLKHLGGTSYGDDAGLMAMCITSGVRNEKDTDIFVPKGFRGAPEDGWMSAFGYYSDPELQTYKKGWFRGFLYWLC